MPNFDQGTELGLYFLNYHSRLPLISGRHRLAGRARQCVRRAECGGRGGAGHRRGPAVQCGGRDSCGGRRAACRGWRAAISSPALAQEYATIGANTLLAGGDVTAQATNIGVHEYAKTARYFTEFPEDIKLLGLSFNTQLQRTGIALQGEVAYPQGRAAAAR